MQKNINIIASMVVAGSLSLPASAATFKIAVGDGPGGTQEYGAKVFSSEFTKLTNNKHKTKIFTGGALGSEQDTVNDAAVGTLDFSVLAANNLAPFSPKMGVLAMPYIFTSLEGAEKVTQGKIGDVLTKQAIEDAGVRVVAWTYAGFRTFTNSKKEVKTPADMKGLVVRVPKNKIMIETYKSWGINPTPMAWSETFTALQQGVVDGQDTPYITIYSMKFHEIQKYATELKYLLLIEPIIMSEAVFQDLSKSEQKAVLAAGKKATLASAKYLRDNESRIKSEMMKSGVKITQPANGEKEFIKRAVDKVWPQFYDKVGGKSFVNQLLTETGRPTVK